jgi:hypothetical protein
MRKTDREEAKVKTAVKRRQSELRFLLPFTFCPLPGRQAFS